MKAWRVLIVLTLIVAPVAARALWFYRGQYTRTTPVPLPDYASLMAPTPPIATPLPEPAPEPTRTPLSGKIVLVDTAHKNRFSPAELENPTRALTGLGARIELAPTKAISLNLALKSADAYVVVAPSILFSAEEVQSVTQFVERGGRLLVIADPTRDGLTELGISAANSVLMPFDLSFADDYIYNVVEYEGNYRNVLFRKFTQETLTEGLDTVALYAAHSVGTTRGIPLVRGDDNTLSSRTDTGGNLSAIALSANQRVVALGDLTFLTPPYHQIGSNSLLIQRLAEFLLSGERMPTLADFPYIFSRDVSIVPTRNVTLTADMAQPLNKLQAALNAVNLAVSMTSAPPTYTDLIVLGLYAPSDDLVSYLKPFTLATPEVVTGTRRSASVPIPGLGNLDRAGTGAMLWLRENDRNTLVLLADNSDNLARLVSLFATGQSSACAIQEPLALCNLGAPKTNARPSVVNQNEED